MFKLTEDELQNAFEAIEHHGYSTLIPAPIEWEFVRNNWEEFKAHLVSIDLDEYSPRKPMRIYAPKNRYTLRSVTLLHPQDLLLYTSMILICKDDIENERISKNKKRIFSYRSSSKIKNQLYQAEGTYQEYRNRLNYRAGLQKSNFVAVADIADFYPRIYQHRLENIISTVSTSARCNEIPRVLVKKFLLNLAAGDSYGIPVGPYASRTIAEAIMIDVDSALTHEGLDFVRWVDDFNFFCKSEYEAQHALFYLARWLFDHHGLTLQSAKTKIFTPEDYVETVLVSHEEELDERSKALKELWNSLGPYDEDEEFLSEEGLAEIEATNLQEMLENSIEDREIIDYEMCAFILGRVASLASLGDSKRLELVDTVLSNIEHLYPISESVARFFSSFKKLKKSDRNRIARRLLRPIKNPGRFPPLDYYVMWILSIFSESDEWGHAEDAAAIFTNHRSDVVKRYAALAIATNGSRAHALVTRDEFERASPLLKTAILLATRRLGADERKHWRRMAGLNGFLEKRI